MKNLVSKLQARRFEKKLATALERTLFNRLSFFNHGVSQDTSEIIQELVGRLGRLKAMDVPADLEFQDVVCFHGDGGGIVFGSNASAEREDFLLDIAKLEKGRFASYGESVQFTEGTQSLLGLLLRFDKMRTKDAYFIALPEVCTFVDDVPIFDKENLDFYGNKRAVYLTVILEHGFMMFGFEEKVILN